MIYHISWANKPETRQGSKDQQMKVSSWRVAGRHKDGDQRITENFQVSEEEDFQRTEQDHRLWEVKLYQVV